MCDTNRCNKESYIPAIKAYRIYKRVIICGDYWLEPIVDLWPKDDPIKPTFAILNRLGVNEIMEKLAEKYDLNNTLIVMSLGTNDFFDYLVHEECDGHKPYKFPVCKKELITSPSGFAGKLWVKLFDVKKRIREKYINSRIIYLTVYPMNLIQHIKHSTLKHQEKYKHEFFKPFLDETTKNTIRKNLPIAFKHINMSINGDTQNDQFPTWGINKILNVKSTEKYVVFPEVNVKESIAKKVILKFQNLIEKSNPLDECMLFQANQRERFYGYDNRKEIPQNNSKSRDINQHNECHMEDKFDDKKEMTLLGKIR